MGGMGGMGEMGGMGLGLPMRGPTVQTSLNITLEQLELVEL